MDWPLQRPVSLIGARTALIAPPVQGLSLTPDYSLIGAALGLSPEPAAVTSSEGALLIANGAYRERFGGSSPPPRSDGRR